MGRTRHRLAALRRARSLLELSRALGDATDTDDAARHIAVATRALTGCDRAIVLLTDGSGRLHPAAVDPGGDSNDAPALVDGGIDPYELGLGGEGPPVLHTHALGDPDGPIVAALTAIRRRDLDGAVSAEWDDATRMPPRPVLEQRLRELADHAAAGLENVALLDAARHRALHDVLTGLPNQALFADRAAQAVTRARRTGERLAIGVLDLDRFKTVNDSLGHGAGDALLAQVADRLRGAVRAPDTVARMGGDEFTLVLPDLLPHGEAVIAERLLAAFEDPFVIDGHAMRISPSIGLASFPDDGDTPERLLRSADAAMYRAKENGRNTWAIYANGMSERAYDRLTLETDLHDALVRRELRVGFQPIVRLADDSVEGVEVVVRWSHPSFGVLGANEFLPLAEEIGIVPSIDAWVLRRACAELARADATL